MIRGVSQEGFQRWMVGSGEAQWIMRRWESVGCHCRLLIGEWWIRIVAGARD